MFSENLRESLDLSLFWEYRVILLKGLEFNLYAFAGAACLAIVLGLLACLLRLSRSRVLAALGGAYAETFRNAPEYVLLVWVHYVPPLLLTLALGTKIAFAPLFSAILALGLAYSGYMTETFRAGIQSVPRGHIEAAEALGMTRGLILRRILLPQALRQMLPEALNQAVSLFKATTLVSLIAVPDLMYNVSMITSQEMRPLPLYTGAALVYCAIIFCFASLVRIFGDRWRARYG
jgi:His/Glu/Gln/Arg/opine family amino acid ABC transporter permease subunit